MKLWSALKKTLKFILVSLILILSAVLTAGVHLWHHPKETWQFVESHFLPPDLKITWKGLKVDLQHLQGWKWSFTGQILHLHIQKKSPNLNLPVDEIQWDLLLQPREPQKWILRRIVLKSTKTLRFQGGPPPQEPVEQSPFERLQGFVALLRKSQNLKINRFEVDVREFIFTNFKGRRTLFSARLLRSRKTPEDVIDFVVGILFPTTPQSQMTTVGSLHLSHFNDKKPFLKAHVDLLGWGLRTRQSILFQAEPKSTLITSTGLVSFKKRKISIRATPTLTLKVSPQKADLRLQAQLQGIPGAILKVPSLRAQAQIPFSTGTLWSERPAVFFVSVPVGLYFIDKNMKAPLEKSCACKIPEEIQMNINGQLWVQHLLSRPRREQQVLASQLRVKSVQNRLFSIQLGAHLDIYKLADEFLFEPSIRSRLQVHSFRGLRNYLDARNLLIPAPLSALDGTLDFKAEGPVQSGEQAVPQFPLRTQVRLGSPTQTVNLDAESVLRFDQSAEFADLRVKVNLHDLQLELPPLNPVGGRPRVTPDARVLKKPRALARSKKRRLRMAFDFEVRTTKPGAIRLLSKYAKPYVPLSLSMSANERKETTGFLQTEPFSIEYLRRLVHVEAWRMSLDETDKRILPVEGRFRIDQADYKIYVHFGGTLQNPNVSLTSVPYLPQDQIISVLLYGRTADQLVAAEAEAAGSFAAAMADRAIGFFGLWAFAATPIQSFSYNPITKVYAATIMITDDFTARIGTNWEETTRVELRKRVSRRWMLTASWTPDEEGDLEEKLVLQWEKRF